MKSAVDKAFEGMRAGLGGPFGAVIVRKNGDNDEIIACEHNRVLSTNDPTMHAEVAAIRAACAKLGRFSLHDCEIYSTCMPCPMCLSAIMWAKIPTLYYGTSAVDAADAGFDDDYIYSFIRNNLQNGKLSLDVIDKEECGKLFTEWKNMNDKEMY
jgi:tRNA(Arg) A34 adenosine deaminase TadA